MRADVMLPDGFKLPRERRAASHRTGAVVWNVLLFTAPGERSIVWVVRPVRLQQRKRPLLAAGDQDAAAAVAWPGSWMVKV